MRKALSLEGRSREVILEAIGFAAEQFLYGGDWQQVLKRVLARLGEATRVSRIRVVKRTREANGTFLLADVASWPDPDDPETDELPFAATIAPDDFFCHLLLRLDDGEVISINRSTQPDFFAAHLEPFKTLSVLIMPIRVNDQPWGYLTASDTRRERKWTAVDENVLRTSANILGAAIQRQLGEEARQRYADQLEERNRDLDMFNKILAHDLKAPLNLMMSTATMIRERYAGSIPEEAAYYLHQIEQQGWQLTDMVNQLLTVALVSNAAELEMAVIDVVAVIEQVRSRLQHWLVERNIRLEVEDSLPNALGYSPWVVEIFANLLSNAIKYIGENNPAPLVQIQGRCIGNGMIRYSVSDNGIGIARDYHDALFKMFSRVNTGIMPGHGLGLALVHQMVTKMHGTCGVMSEPGQGSTFWFTLSSVVMCPDI